MQRLSLTLARLAITFWVGGALLFVTTSVAEQRFAFPQTVKNELALIRFPWYYRFGFTLLGVTLVAGHLARNHGDLRGPTRLLIPSTLALSLTLMAIDYQWVYLPLAELMTPADKPMAPAFQGYHHASKWINITHVGLATAAAVFLCRAGVWPGEPSDSRARVDTVK